MAEVHPVSFHICTNKLSVAIGETATLTCNPGTSPPNGSVSSAAIAPDLYSKGRWQTVPEEFLTEVESYLRSWRNFAPSRSFAKKLPWAARMARFFFHVTNGSTFKDEEGENWPSLEAARAHAAKIASELWQAGGYEGYAVSVADQQGNEVAYFPIGGSVH